MASLSESHTGARVLPFMDCAGKRRTVRLGQLPKRATETIRLHVEQLRHCQLSGHPPDAALSAWLGTIDTKLRNKLAAVGLVPNTSNLLLGDFVQHYLVSRPDVNSGTKAVYRQAQRSLVQFFGADKPLQDITAGDADSGRAGLRASRLSPATQAKRTKSARQFFRAALRRKLITENPFTDVHIGSQVNASRRLFIGRGIIDEVLQACPDNEWRLLIALARFQAMRMPSEARALRWLDIDWEKQRMRIRSSKTAHHEGKASRMVPIFPEVLPYLQRQWDKWQEVEGGNEYALTRLREGNSGQLMTNGLNRILDRARLEAWPRLWQNLRASRETELADQYPIHVVCSWIGNSALVAARHYLSVTEAHFQQAVNTEESGENSSQKSAAKSAAAHARTPLHQGTAVAKIPRNAGVCSQVH